jgi:hypothetical protein
VRDIRTLVFAWGDEFKKLSAVEKGADAKRVR